MHFFIHNHRLTRLLDGLNICLALSSAALLGVGRRGGFSSHKFYTCLLDRLTYAHYWYFLFLKFHSPTPWTLRKTYRDTLCSWGFHFDSFCVRCFWRKLRSFWQTWCQLMFELVGIFPPILLVLFSLVSSFLRHTAALLWMVLYGILYLGLPAWQGLRGCQRDCFATASNVPGILIPAFLFRRFVTKKFSAGLLPFSMMVFPV